MEERKDGERIGLFGSSGCGKTTKGRQLIKSSKRLVIYDPKEEWAYKASLWLGKCDLVNNFEAFLNVLSKKWKRGFKIVYTPRAGKEVSDLDKVAKVIYQAQTMTSPQITLFVDEAQDGVPAGIGMRDPSNGVLAIARKGRDRGINLIVAAQRVKGVDIGIRANLSYCYFFRLRELADIKEANQLIHDIDGLLSMQNFEYWLIDKNGCKTFFPKK